MRIIKARPHIQLPLARQFPFLLRKKGDVLIAFVDTENLLIDGFDVDDALQCAQIELGFSSNRKDAEMRNRCAVTHFRIDPVAAKEVAAILNSVFERVVENARTAVAVIRGTPFQHARCIKGVGIGGFHKIAEIGNPRAAIVENGRPPGDWLNPLRPAKQCRHPPVVPREIAEQVITLLAVHIDGATVVGGRRIGLREIDRVFPGIVQHRA